MLRTSADSWTHPVNNSSNRRDQSTVRMATTSLETAGLERSKDTSGLRSQQSVQLAMLRETLRDPSRDTSSSLRQPSHKTMLVHKSAKALLKNSTTESRRI